MSSHRITLEPDLSKFKAPHKGVVYNAYHLRRKPTWDIQGGINKSVFESYKPISSEKENSSVTQRIFWQTRLWSS